MWGFADIHAHPMAHLAFGGHLIWGLPNGPLADAFPPCDGIDHCAYSRIVWVDVAKQVLDGISQTERESPSMWNTWVKTPDDHPRDGFPTFNGWPFAGSMCHQQMHLEWLKRAYDHGLRLMSALAVNNRLLAWLMENGNECWDDATVCAQVNEMCRLAQLPENRSWMEVAYSADHAERIVTSNKLAIVLGVEVDQIELFFSRDPRDLEKLNDEAEAFLSGAQPSTPLIASLAQRLHDLGIRQITPLHFADNVFGGNAIYLDRQSTNSRWIQLWRAGRSGSPRWGWPDVVVGSPDIEFRLQELQLPANRTWSIFAPPFGDPVSIYTEDVASHANARGLMPAGLVFLLELWRRGIIVDIDHMSERTAECALNLAERVDVPVISSHCWVRHITLDRAEICMPADWWKRWDGRTPTKTSQPGWPMLRHEGMRTEKQLARIYKLGGIAATLLRQPAVRKPKALSNVDAARPVMYTGTTTAAAAAYLAVVEIAGSLGAVGIGSDVDGLAQLPTASACCAPTAFNPYGSDGLSRLRNGDREWDVNADGVAHYGMIPDLIYRWRAEGMSNSETGPLFRSANGYIDTWHRVESAATRVPTASEAIRDIC